MANKPLTPEEAKALAAKLMQEEVFESFWSRIKESIPVEDQDGCYLVAKLSWEVSRSTAVGIPLEIIMNNMLRQGRL